MPAPPVIVNNTPLVALWSVEQLELLKSLFGTIWIPTTVETEFLATETAARQQVLTQSTWLQTKSLSDPRQALTYTGLDSGEAEVLALALEHKARLVIIDERKGRQYARRLRLPLTGTLGVLLLAKEKKLLASITPLVNQLLEQGLYLDPNLVSRILALAGED